MPFWDHMDEFRSRIITCLYVFFIGFIISYFFSDQILNILRHPLFSQLPKERQHLYYTGLFENFFVHLKVSAYASLIFCSPVYFLILWSFIAPGLYGHERKSILPFVVFGSLFFLIGVMFAYFFLFPFGVKYFLTYGTEAEIAWLTLDNYIALVLKVLLGFGFCFQLPVVLVLLVKIGLLSGQTLMKQRRSAIVIIAIIAALVAPPDAISMLLLMLPLYFLFEGSLLVIQKIEKNKS